MRTLISLGLLALVMAVPTAALATEAGNPCNPCGDAKNPCNPCGEAANPCNPCGDAANPCNPCGGDDMMAMVDHPAPDFGWKVDDETIHLADLKDERVVAILFWSTNCPKCLHDIPAMNDQLDMLTEAGVQLVGVNIAMNETRAQVAAYVSDQDLGFPTIYDKGGKITGKYDISGPYQLALVDHHGILRYLGAVPTDLDDRLQALAGELAADQEDATAG